MLQSPPTSRPAIIVDDAGEIIWYYLPGVHRVHDIRRLENGNLAYEVWPGTDGMLEIDMLGNIVNRWHFTGTAKEVHEGSIPVATDSIHHDYVELPNGNFLLMSSENRVIDDWPANYELDGQTQQANVIGDVIIEMTRAGDVLREWKLHDIIDPYRLGYNSRREDFWANHYDGVVDGIVYDWTHGNAIIYEEEDNSFVMSMPYQDAVVKISMDTGELVWILGNHDNWQEPWSDKLLTPAGDVGWSYKHHAISHTENGTYLLFDNGVARSSPPDERMSLEDSYSRAVEYSRQRRDDGSFEQVWVYGPDDEPFYGRYLGDVDWHAGQTDNILINVGGRETNAAGLNAPPGMGTQRWASLIEVTHDQPAEKVWQMRSPGRRFELVSLSRRSAPERLSVTANLHSHEIETGSRSAWAGFFWPGSTYPSNSGLAARTPLLLGQQKKGERHAQITDPILATDLVIASSIVSAQSQNQDEIVARGAYLADGILGCGNCHTPKSADFEPIIEMKFAGAFVIEEPGRQRLRIEHHDGCRDRHRRLERRRDHPWNPRRYPARRHADRPADAEPVLP